VPLTRSIRATAWKEHLDEGRLTERLLAGLPLTAASFIVTVYGDAVLPRGEVLSMSSLIEICADVGISENLVRTATSRLVASGRLEGERSGRHSFYRLAPAAHGVRGCRAPALHEPDGGGRMVGALRSGHRPGRSPSPPHGANGRRRLALPAAGRIVAGCRFRAPRNLARRNTGVGFLAAGFVGAQARYDMMLKRFQPWLKASLAAATSRRTMRDRGASCWSTSIAARFCATLVCQARLCPPIGAEEARRCSSRSIKSAPAADAEIGRRMQERNGLLPARTKRMTPCRAELTTRRGD
jgi:phenylacetic acid degradation operon negative regulatory protein